MVIVVVQIVTTLVLHNTTADTAAAAPTKEEKAASDNPCVTLSVFSVLSASMTNIACGEVTYQLEGEL